MTRSFQELYNDKEAYAKYNSRRARVATWTQDILRRGFVSRQKGVMDLGDVELLRCGGNKNTVIREDSGVYLKTAVVIPSSNELKDVDKVEVEVTFGLNAVSAYNGVLLTEAENKEARLESEFNAGVKKLRENVCKYGVVLSESMFSFEMNEKTLEKEGYDRQVVMLASLRVGDILSAERGES